ncbi:MAG TPA: DUF2752 domain-containing protein [Candidatus Angelobacter sp.]|nr:DUF2752 domain-containing protein [Candidatus Angelobacter sp.]
MRSLKEKRSRITFWIAAGCAALGVLYRFPPSQYSIYPRCPFYAATHLLCPGCGGTRALYELLHMNLRGALHYNALVTVLVPVALAWLAWGCRRAYRDGLFPPVPWPRSTALVLGAVALLFAVIRDSGIAFVI